jgi:hypothetical protein
MRRIGIGALLLVVWACADDPTGQQGGATRAAVPRIAAAMVAANPQNALSAVVPVTAHDAESVLVVVRRGGADGPVEAFTPAFRLHNDTVTIPVLGLFPASDYTLAVLAYGEGLVIGRPLSFTTGALPLDLPSYAADGPRPAGGFVAVAAANGKYALVIDNTGRVVWYRYFPDGVGLNFMPQPTGHYVLRPPTPAAGDVEPWIELDVLGDITRTLTCLGGLQTRPHDLILEPDGGYWIMCDEMRTMDLSGMGGVANARVTGTVIQHISASGELVFRWSPFDHFDITDLEESERTGANVNWTHGNALDLDAAGNLIASFRSLNEVTCIEVPSGTVRWRLGGLRNQFSFVDTPVPAFTHQHGVRIGKSGQITLLDNIGNPNESRAERYVVDVVAHTAFLVQSYGSIPGVRTEIGGSVQQLEAGRTLVSFGTAGRVEEYDSADRLLWHIEGNAGYVFRAQRIQSLYQPGVGDPR